MFFFQLPWLPEFLISRNNWEGAIRALRGSARRGTFSQADLAGYRQAWSQPGAFTGMLNWYRALFRHPPTRADNYRISTPVRMIWGKRDAALEWQMAEKSLEMCEQAELFFLEEATHWVQHDEPEQVNRLLLEFLQD